MSDQLLRLCKRLNKFTLDDLVQLTEYEETTIEFGLLYLENNRKIKKQNDYYIYITEDGQHSIDKRQKKQLPLMFKHHSPETVDLIIRCFCAEIPSHKTACLVEPSTSCVNDFYTTFRKLIYENQYKELLEHYSKNPQQGRFRLFFKELKVYFYIYNSQVYVAERLLQSDNECNFTKAEVSEFKKIYCYLSRIESHNKHKSNLCFHLAEKLWRREKSFDYLYEDMKNLINC